MYIICTLSLSLSFSLSLSLTHTHTHTYIIYIYIYIYIYIDKYLFTNPSEQAGYDIRSIFLQRLKAWIQSFPSKLAAYQTSDKEPSLPYYFPITGGRIHGFIAFTRVSSRIWSHVAVSISYEDTPTAHPHYIYVISRKKPIFGHIRIIDLFPSC